MKYTRFDLKKKRNSKISIILICIMILGLLLVFKGRMMGRIENVDNKITKNDITKNDTRPIKKKASEISNSSENKVSQVKSTGFYVIQCGAFAKKENSEILINQLQLYGPPFMINEEKRFKVILGIYEEKNLKPVIDMLEKNKIPKAKFHYDITEDSLCNSEIVELIKANLEIVNKFKDNTIAYIKTEQLKKWTNSLKAIKDENKNIEVLNNLKEFTVKLPDKLKKDDAVKIYENIYRTLKKIQ